MNLICYLRNDHTVDIRPSRNRRKWMDQMPYSYRCLPLSIANAHGWEVHCPVTCEAQWNGGSKTDDVQVTIEDGRNSFLDVVNLERNVVESHFGGGILTFNLGLIINTCPGYDLWVTGPVNEFKDGIQALSAVIEAYWMPHTFTMNWKFTRPNLKVRFERGEPFCLFFPIEHRLLERFDPTFKKISEDPGLERQHKVAVAERLLPVALKRAGKELKEKDRKRLWWQGWYMRGEMPDGTEVVDHQRRIELRPFKDGS